MNWPLSPKPVGPEDDVVGAASAAGEPGVSSFCARTSAADSTTAKLNAPCNIHFWLLIILGSFLVPGLVGLEPDARSNHRRKGR